MNHIECFPSSLLNKNASSDRYISHCKSNAFHLNSFSMNFYIKHYCLLGALVSRLLIRTKQVFIFIKPCIYIFVYLCMYFIIYLRYLSKFFSMQMSQETQFLLINQVLTIGGIFFSGFAPVSFSTLVEPFPLSGFQSWTDGNATCPSKRACTTLRPPTHWPKSTRG